MKNFTYVKVLSHVMCYAHVYVCVLYFDQIVLKGKYELSY
jgi:hypothetical protein